MAHKKIFGLLCILILGASASPPSRSVMAQTPARINVPPWPSACLTRSGLPVVPQYKPGSNYAWSFVANFNQSPSEASVLGCLAEAEPAPSGVGIAVYATLTFCTIENNITIPRAKLGGGTAVFNGSVYLKCSLRLKDKHRPDFFWVRTRAVLPVASQTYTLFTSDAATFSVATDAGCNPTLTSTYDKKQVANSVTGAYCGAMTDFGTRLRPDDISHAVNGLVITPVHTPSLTIGISKTYEFQIGAVGQMFTLDDFIIDPRPMTCCGAG